MNFDYGNTSKFIGKAKYLFFFACVFVHLRKYDADCDRPRNYQVEDD